MASKRYGVVTREWHKHLRKRHGTKQAQEKLTRQDGDRQCTDGVYDYVGPRMCWQCSRRAVIVTGKKYFCDIHSFMADPCP